MEDQVRSILEAWSNFYVIVGSSAAALTGLQFVVMALVSNLRRSGGSWEIATFGTPNIVHFSGVLLISAMLTAPWRSFVSLSVLLGICGVVGIVYGIITVRRARRQSGYKPVFEDWLFHAVLPIIAYTLQLTSALTLRSNAQTALFIIASSALLLLFIGIHNAWDTVTYLAINFVNKETSSDD